ncbi:MAG: class I SAM-dependent methyltransferase [Polyangiaceae bacterium]
MEDGPLVESTLAAKGDVITFWMCTCCTLVFRMPRPSPTALAHYYSSVLAKREPEILRKMGVSPETMNARNRVRYEEVYEDVYRGVRKTRGHIIDLGGWDGASLAPWRGAGWSTTLIDPSAPERALARSEMGIAATVNDARALGRPPADIITSYHCVEHIDDLAKWADDVRCLCSNETLWVIEVPLELPHVRGLLGRKPLRSPQVHEEHLNFFTPQALRGLAGCMGLRALKVKMVVTLYYFGPTVSFRLYARDGGSTAPARSEKSPARLRAELRVKLPVWRRVAGLKYRWYRARHPGA